MDYKDMIIKDPVEFDKALELINSVVDIQKSFPDQVFRDQFKIFVFDQFRIAVTPDFLPVLKQLAEVSSDNEIVIATIDLDKTGSLHRCSSHFFFKIPITLTQKEFWKLLYSQPSTCEFNCGRFELMAYDVVWVPLSAKWAIWGSRDYEICILSFADASCRILAEDLIGEWGSVHEALEQLIVPVFSHGRSIPQEFRRAALLNYSDK